MKFGSDLRAWTRDAERLRAARRAADRVAMDWAKGPAHRRFDAALADLPHDAEAVVDAVRTLFSDDHWVDSLVSTLAEEMRRDPFFEPPFRHINSDIHKGLIVYEDDHVSVAAGVSSVGDMAAKKNRPRGPTSVAFSGQVSLFKFVRAGEALLSFWTAPRIDEQFQASRAGRCRRVGQRRIADGEILVIDGSSESFVIEHGTTNMVLLQATVKPGQAPLNVEYDSETGEYVGCSAADDSASRIQMITTLLRKLGHREAFGAIAPFLAHPHFFVRWHVMRELLGLDAAAALPLLARMAGQDPHAETRRAARSVLDRVDVPFLRQEAA